MPRFKLRPWRKPQLGVRTSLGVSGSLVVQTQTTNIPVWYGAPTFSATAGETSAWQDVPVYAAGDIITLGWHSSNNPALKPAWVEFQNGANPKIRFLSTIQDSNDVAPLVLMATANGQTVLSATGQGSLIVAPAYVPSTGTVTSITLSHTGTQPWTVGQVFKKADVTNSDVLTLKDPNGNVVPFQVDIRNRWDDQSVRFAVISGVSAPGVVTIKKNDGTHSAPNVALPASFSTSGQNRVTFTSVTDSTGATVQGGTLTADLSAAVNAGAKTWTSSADRTTPGLIRSIPGPVMSEFHYFVPTADAHTHVWFYVRAYSTAGNGVADKVEVETVVENGWLKIALPGSRDYRAQVTIGGTLRYDTGALINQLAPSYPSQSRSTSTVLWYSDIQSTKWLCPGAQFYVNGITTTPYRVASNSYYYDVATDTEWRLITIASGSMPTPITSVSIIGHVHHTRWSRVDWLVEAGAPAVAIKHDTAYLQSTDLLPTIAVTSLDTTAYTQTPDGYLVKTISQYTSNAVSDQPAPFDSHGVDRGGMGAGGDKDAYGMVPSWFCIYLVEGDARAFRCTVGNGRELGRYVLHYRNEATGRPYRITDDQTLTINGTNSGMADQSPGSNVTPTPTGPTFTYAHTHSPSSYFAAYLLTGRWQFSEGVQFQAGVGAMRFNANYGTPKGLPWWDQLRGNAWVFRDITHAALITPQSETASRTAALAYLENCVSQFYDYYISGTSVTKPAQYRQNPFGLPFQNSDNDLGFNNNDGECCWSGLMTGGYITSMLYAFDAEPEISNYATKLAPLAAFHAKFPIGMLGAAVNGSTWDWRVFSFVSFGFATPGALTNGGDASEATQVFRASWDANWTAVQASPAYNWEAGTWPLTPGSDNYIRKVQFNDTTGQKLSVRTYVNDDTDTRFLMWTAQYAHRIADKLELLGHPLYGIQTAIERLNGSDTWKNTLTSRARTRPDYAIVTDRSYGVPTWVPSYSAAQGNSDLVQMTNSPDTLINTNTSPWFGTNIGDVAVRPNISDYSGGAYNPYYSTYGAMMVHGGGHASCNWNGVLIADMTDRTWKLDWPATDLSLIAGTAGAPAEDVYPTIVGKYARYPNNWGKYPSGNTPINSSGMVSSYDYFIRHGKDSTGWNDPLNVGLRSEADNDSTNPRELPDGAPGSAHTYDSLFVVPPEKGGAANGTLVRLVSFAVGTSAAVGGKWSHGYDCTKGKNGQFPWSRFSATAAPATVFSHASAVAFDYARAKAWVLMSPGNNTYAGVLNTQTKAWSVSSGVAQVPSGYTDNIHGAFHQGADIAVVVTGDQNADPGTPSYGTNGYWYWFRGDSDGTARTPVNWVKGVPPPWAQWGGGTVVYVSHLNKLFYWTKQRPDSYYLITVPAPATGLWDYTEYPIVGAGRPSQLSPAPASSVYHRMDYAPALKSIIYAPLQSSSTGATSLTNRIVVIRIAP